MLFGGKAELLERIRELDYRVSKLEHDREQLRLTVEDAAEKVSHLLNRVRMRERRQEQPNGHPLPDTNDALLARKGFR